MEEDDLSPMKLERTKSWKEYEARDEIPMILNEGLLPIKFQGAEFQEMDYEGALRFYFIVSGQSELTKAVRLTNRTTVSDLIPTLVDKFSLSNDKEYSLFENHDSENAVLLNLEECPLARAISTKKVPRFVLKVKEDNNNNSENQEEIIQADSGKEKKDKKKKLFSISVGGVGSKKTKSEEHNKSKSEKPKKQKKKKKSNKTDGESTVNNEEEVLSDDALDEGQLNGHHSESEEKITEENSTLLSITHSNSQEGVESSEQSNSEVFGETEIVAAEFIEPVYALPDSFVDIPESEQNKTEQLASSTEIHEEESFTAEAELEVESAIPQVDDEKPEIVDIEQISEEEATEEINSHRKLSFSNSSIFFEQDNDPPQLELKGKKKTKKKSKSNKLTSEKRSKSFSEMLKGQKKKHSDNKEGQTELSTNKLTPGILKVFGDHVSKGSNYKAVRVSTISTSQEVVRMALEKYGFEDANPKDYVLCDVVGRFTLPDGLTKNTKKPSKGKKNEKHDAEEEQPQWTTEYVRAVHENEKPLVLQSLWKPTNGRSRRFELRRKIDVESSCFFINTADSSGRRNSETSLFDDSDHSSIVSGSENRPTSRNDQKEFAPPNQLSPHSKTNKISDRQKGNDFNLAPQYAPYLLLLQGCDNNSDNILHKLEDPTIIVGPYMEGEPKQCNITLFSEDILLPHCWIYKKVKLEEDSSETNLDEINFLVFIEPANGADITINGQSVTSTTLIKQGQLIGFGKRYLFIFKDPTQLKSSSNLPKWVEKLKQQAPVTEEITSPVLEAPVHQEPEYAIPIKHQVSFQGEDKAVQVQLAEQAVFSDHTEESEDASDASEEETEISQNKYQAPRKQVEKSNLQLSYDIKEEEELLHTIIDIADEELGVFKMTPSYLFMMTIEHSAASFTEIQTRKLLLKISSGLQGIAWEKTKEIGKQSSAKEDNPILLMNRVLPELKPVLFWMSSALEMLHFLQCNLSSYLLKREQVTTSKEALLTADEELLTVLEEVIMFTFQQTVYHLTKILYVALPSIIDVNPFQNEEAQSENNDQKRVHPSIVNIINIFTNILNAAKEYQIHSQIISQLFAYLFFFSNASLFNSLMERGPGGKFYCWTKGVQMRGNIDALENWAQTNDMGSQFEQYMSRFLCTTDLLSTPKVQLMQMEWKQMRMDFSSLNPAQLQQLLGEYQLDGKQRPREWYPPPEEVEPALRSSEVLESFATHPPLILPSSNFTMDLTKRPDSEEFFHYLDMINEKFGPKLNGTTSQNDTTKQSPSKKKNSRTKSNIDLEYVESAMQHAKKKSSEITGKDEKGQVGSINSIQVQSKRTSITITPKKESNSNPILLATPSASTDHTLEPAKVTENGVDDLIKQARVLINADDVTDDEDDVDKNLSGNLNGDDDVFIVELVRGNRGLGLGLIDGMFTSLKNNGIYIRTIVPDTPASEESKLRIGDQILAVNGTSLVGSDYSHAMELIKKAGSKLSFLIAKSDEGTMNQILTAST